MEANVKDDYSTDFFKFNLFEIKFAGMWVPFKSSPNRKRVLAFNIFYLAYTQVFYTFAELYMLPSMASDMFTLMRLLGIGFTHNLGTFKVMSYFTKRKRMFKMMRTLQSSDFHYRKWDGINFRPELYVERAKKLSTYYNKFFFFMANLVPTAAYLSTIVLLVKVKPNDLESGTVTCYDILPFIAWIPFDIDSKKNCSMAILFLALPIYIFAWQIAAHDTLFIAVLTYARAHLQILVKAFETIRQRSLAGLGLPLDLALLYDSQYPELEGRLEDEMKKCSTHLQTVIGVCEEIESCFTYATLGQTLVSLFTLAATLYMVSNLPIYSIQFVSQFIYLSAMIYQLGSYCWFGNQITLTGQLIPTAIYSSDWQSTNARHKSSMLINMIRMVRPLHVTVGKFTPLTLSTLLTIVRGAYSYFAVLKNSQR